MGDGSVREITSTIHASIYAAIATVSGDKRVEFDDPDGGYATSILAEEDTRAHDVLTIDRKEEVERDEVADAVLPWGKAILSPAVPGRRVSQYRRCSAELVVFAPRARGRRDATRPPPPPVWSRGRVGFIERVRGLSAATRSSRRRPGR